MKYANEIMSHDIPTVSPDMPVGKLARLLLDHRLDGVCVVDEGKVVGVVTAMDLIYQQRELHLPTIMTVFERLARFGKSHADAELQKMTGTLVRDIMTTEVRTVPFDASLETVAGLMVEQNISTLPVTNGAALQGVINKADVLRAAFG